MLQSLALAHGGSSGTTSGDAYRCLLPSSLEGRNRWGGKWSLDCLPDKGKGCLVISGRCFWNTSLDDWSKPNIISLPPPWLEAGVEWGM